MPTPTPVRGSTACPTLAAATATSHAAHKRLSRSHGSAYLAAWIDAYIVDALGLSASRVYTEDTSLIPRMNTNTQSVYGRRRRPRFY